MNSADNDYLVNLDVFRGPLDLLLYLVKREEVDIRDIPIARVAEQFKHYLDVVQLIDVERAGDFLVMAATLMEIKARLLLPRPADAVEEEEDPRLELVRQLVQYKKFKDAAALLEERATLQSQRLPRTAPPPSSAPGLPPLRPVELWDLVSAFGRLMRETMAGEAQAIVVDQTPIQVYMEQILEHLRRTPRLPFSSLFTPPYTRSRLLGLFLAILELTKSRRIRPEQPEPFGDIWMTLEAEQQPATSPSSGTEAQDSDAP